MCGLPGCLLHVGRLGRYAVAFILDWSERRSQRLSLRGKERMSRRQQRVTHGYRRFLCVGHTQSRVGR